MGDVYSFHRQKASSRNLHTFISHVSPVITNPKKSQKQFFMRQNISFASRRQLPSHDLIPISLLSVPHLSNKQGVGKDVPGVATESNGELLILHSPPGQ